MRIIFVNISRDKKVGQEIAFSDDDWDSTREGEYSGLDSYKNQ